MGLQNLLFLLVALGLPRRGPCIPCAPGAVSLEVASQLELQELREAVDCEGGEFTVTWSGELVLSSPLLVGSGTKLVITGEGEGPAADGANELRLCDQEYILP
ncbi:unnamed protein product [Chrysoparadoxa australica]